MGQAKRRATKFGTKAVGCGILDRFPNLDKCRSEGACVVISSVTVDYVVVDVRATFDESGLNSGRIILLYAGRTRFTRHFCPVFCCILQPIGSSQLRRIRQIYGDSYPDNRVKISYTSINFSR